MSEIYKCINGVQAALSKVGISKDGVNTMQKYNFRGIDDVYNALAPLLAEHGLCILPRVIDKSVVDRVSQKGGTLIYATVTVAFDFVCVADGSKHEVITVGEAMDSGDKATNKALSAAYKYACLQTFCIPTEGGESADSETDSPRPAPAKKPESQQESLINTLMQTIHEHQLTHMVNDWCEHFEVKQLSHLPQDTMQDIINQIRGH